MFILAITTFFKYKAVGSVIVLACWPLSARVKFINQVSQHGLRATFSCDPSILDTFEKHHLQGVLYIREADDRIVQKVKREHYTETYKWLVIGDDLPDAFSQARYDVDIAAMSPAINETVYFYDVYVHPRDGTSIHPWAFWTISGLVLTHDKERILRRLNLKKYPLKIATPVGVYTDDWYSGTFAEYLVDQKMAEFDSGIRCGYQGSAILIEALNATEVIIQTLLWGAEVHNSSMVLMLESGKADLSGAILRILVNRITRMDYVLSIWPFNVGFTYLAERESSSNMFVEPFTVGVWWIFLGICLVLAIALRICSQHQIEKEGAYIAVIATYLQQDASAVPEGTSGRWTFLVISISSMLVHAYYTSAIVSALMSTGKGGPDSLRSLADSKYAIASEDYDYMRYLFFDVETNWDDLEYLKRKKMTSKFYQELERGVELIEQGHTAFHSEYNQIYPHFKSFSDDHICKLQHVDTIPETMTWVLATAYGQWSDIFRSTGAWLHETGLAKRVVSHLIALRPPCRAALLAERVKFGDVATLIALSALGVILSLILLGVEILIAKWDKRRTERVRDADRQTAIATANKVEKVDWP